MQLFLIFYFFLYINNLYLFLNENEIEANNKLNELIILYFKNPELAKYYLCEKIKQNGYGVACSDCRPCLLYTDINSFLHLDFKIKKEFFESIVKGDCEKLISFNNFGALSFKNYDSEKNILREKLIFSMEDHEACIAIKNSESKIKFCIENKELGIFRVSRLQGNQGNGRILMQIFIKLCLFLRNEYNLKSISLVDVAKVNNIRAFSYYLKYGFEYSDTYYKKKLLLDKIQSIDYDTGKSILTPDGRLSASNLTNEELQFFNNEFFRSLFS